MNISFALKRLSCAAVVALPLLCGANNLQAQSQTISLATTMDGNSLISEYQATGGFSRINLGDGKIGTAGYIGNPENPNYPNSGDRDGHYRNERPVGESGFYTLEEMKSISAPLAIGSGWDLFPREQNFLVGGITFDMGGLDQTLSGTTQITGLNMSEFWKPDPNRVSGVPGNGPTVISDISDQAIGLWFFDGSGGIGFGGLDATDTVTFNNGLLTSIDLNVTTTFSVSAPFLPGSDTVWDGIFSISGNQFAYQINQTQAIPFYGDSTFIADLTGTVNAVGDYQLSAVPEPSSFALLSLACGGATWYRRRFRKKNKQLGNQEA